MSAIDHFLALGMAPEDARSRADFVDRVGRGFLEVVGGPAAWTWFVPGRLELVGKHTDYAGGRSLLAAVPRGFAVAAGPRADGIVRAIDLADGARADIDPADDAHTRRGWSSYVQVVARRFARNFPGAALGLDLVFVERPASRGRALELERPRRRGCHGAGDARAARRSRGMAGPHSQRRRRGVVLRVRRERHGLRRTARVGRRGHARRQRGPHGDSRLPVRSRESVPLRARDTTRRHGAAVTLVLRRGVERRARRQSRIRARPVQPRVPGHARAARVLEPGGAGAGAVAGRRADRNRSPARTRAARGRQFTRATSPRANC